jgi:hypothetical protein
MRLSISFEMTRCGFRLVSVIGTLRRSDFEKFEARISKRLPIFNKKRDFEMENAVPRPCAICSSTEKARVATEMYAAGRLDREVAAAVGVSVAAANRHKLNHASTEVADREAQALPGRDDLTDPTTYVEKGPVTNSLEQAERRYKRIADKAESNGQSMVALSAVNGLVRVAEARTRLGQVGGYAPPKATPAEPVKFNLVIHMGNGRTRQISGTPIGDVPDPSVIDAVPSALPVIPPAFGDAEPGDDEVLVDKMFDAVQRTHAAPDAPPPETTDGRLLD